MVMDKVVDVEVGEMVDDVDDEDESKDRNEIDHFDDDVNVEHVQDSMVELMLVQSDQVRMVHVWKMELNWMICLLVVVVVVL